MTKSFNVKALGAFKKLGAVTLMVATLAMFFTACKQTGGGDGKPKHEVTFGVEGGNGWLFAKVDGMAETKTSPIAVEEGKTVTFIVSHGNDYRLKEWKVDGIVISNKTNIYTHTVTQPATVSVSFEPIPKYTVTLNQTANGTVTASPEIPEDKQVAKDTEITFTATANEGYKIGKWTVTPAEALQAGTGADGSETAKVKITADTTVSVSFEVASVEGGAVLILSPDKLNIKAKAKTADGSAITVEGCNETTLASDTETTLTATGTKVILKGKITELNLDGAYNNKQPLTAINVQGLTALQGLYCSYNQLTELNVQGLTALQGLSCVDNQLTELNVQGLTSLQMLFCYYNKLTALNASGCASLQKLYCYDNKLTALNVQGLTALQRLACGNNQLTALDVQGCTSLQTFFCGSNQLSELNVQGLTALQELNCSWNQLTSLNVQGCASLQGLYCYNNQLSELNVQGCTSLQTFFCGSNQLSELNVQGLTALQKLDCPGNQLNAQAMTKLLNALPAREASHDANAVLYTEETGITEGNHKDFTQPAELKAAFDGAKKRNWNLQKIDASGDDIDI